MLIARNVRVGQSRSSFKLEPELWDGVDEVCRRSNWTRDEFARRAVQRFQDRPVTSALRTFVFEFFRDQAAQAQAGEERGSVCVRCRGEVPG